MKIDVSLWDEMELDEGGWEAASIDKARNEISMSFWFLISKP